MKTAAKTRTPKPVRRPPADQAVAVKSYRKNAILVHHTGKKISSQNVTFALAEE